jgi:ferredoxin--NADP+ reductase
MGVTSEATAGDPILREARMHLVPVTSPVTGTVVSNDLCMRGKSASFVRHTVIDVRGTALAGNFLSGQSFGVIPPGVDEFGKPHKVRLYSIACSTTGEDGQGNHVSTTPKRLIDERKPQRPGEDPGDHRLFLGVCSNYLCDLRPGDPVKVTGPNGKRFVLPVNPDDHDYLFLATGTGIAPFRGFVMELLAGSGAPCRSEVRLVMGSPYTTDLLYDDLFRSLAAQHPNFRYDTAISRETRSNGRPGQYVHQLMEERIDDFRPMLASPRTLIYVCGLAGMQFGIFKVMAQHGVSEGYLSVNEELAGVDPARWTPDDHRRRIRPTRRVMLEVY